uniref:Uncharacterized protein n=1 Tax=Tanacetum cinerariifolium TaxID=118510 RepID=A0A6L2MR70_TANCI|nr:hypothetical protein [Tanacetum cinerariifolium]
MIKVGKKKNMRSGDVHVSFRDGVISCGGGGGFQFSKLLQATCRQVFDFAIFCVVDCDWIVFSHLELNQ